MAAWTAPRTAHERPPLTPERQALLSLIESRGLERRAEPFRLSSGEWSRDYVDGKLAVSDGAHLELASKVVLQIASARGIEFEAVGGLTMGADPLAHGIAVVGSRRWFSVRKDPKGHGKGRLIEGTELAPGDRVLLVDDVVTTGGSVLRALEAVEEAGAAVVLAVTLIDRGTRAGREFARLGIAYEPVATFRDLGIDPVGAPPAGATAAG